MCFLHAALVTIDTVRWDEQQMLYDVDTSTKIPDLRVYGTGVPKRRQVRKGKLIVKYIIAILIVVIS